MAEQADTRAGAVNVIEVLDRAELTGFHLRVLGLCALVAVIDGFDTTAMAVVASSVARDWEMDLSTFAPALAASLIGMAIGGAIGGVLGDKFGRRWPLILAFALAMAATAGTGLAGDLTQLEIGRFLTGVGVGATIPLSGALVAEYMPARQRAFLLVLMFSGHALGGMCAGLFAPILLEAFGWRGVFYAGGIAPIAVLLALVLLLPESVRFLAGRAGAEARLSKILAHVEPTTSFSPQQRFVAPEEKAARGSVAALFTEGRALRTSLLWMAFFATQFTLFMLASWMPALLTQSGHSISTASFASMTHNLGGVIGSIAVGLASDRLPPHRVLLGVNLGSIVFILGLGAFSASPWVLVFAALSGVCVLSAQLCLNAFTTQLYPTALRATGVGWGLSFGRLGAILSPLVTGALLAHGWNAQSLLYAAAIAPAFAVLAYLFMRVEPNAPAPSVTVGH